MTGKPELEPYLVLGQELFRRVYAEDSADDIHDWLSAQLRRLAGTADEAAWMSWVDSFDVYEEIMRKRAALAALPESERRIPTWPWATWRRLIDPLDPGMLAVLSAADGGGKTLYAECLAEHWARHGLNVVYVHFELNRALMLDRRTARHTGIPRRTLKEGVLTGQEEARRARANDELRAWPGSISYLHTPGWTMERTLAAVGTAISDGLCDVFVVDYLEKASASSRQIQKHGSNIYARETDDVELIKDMAEKTEIPALLLAQMNKAGKKESFAELDRTAIRGAGEKTERANVVILLHRDNPESEVVKVRVDKNSLGPPGSFEQFVDFPLFNVVDIEDEEAPVEVRAPWAS